MKDESTTETEIVTANCWNSLPEIPPTNDIGMKTASSTTVVATIGDATLRIASMAASWGFIPRSILTCAASTTTIASSTTSPMASTNPSSEMILIENPSNGKKMNVPIIGLVENMSYLLCPDCGRKISVFGESKADEVAKEYGIPMLAKLPIDPKIADSVDQGVVEYVESPWLDEAADIIEKM